MESPLSKVSRDMERLNQSLARMKAVDSVLSTAAEKSNVTTSNESLTMNQSNILPQPNNQILSSLESSFSSPIPYSTRLRLNEEYSLPLPQSKGDIPHLQLNTNNSSTSPSFLNASEELMQARILAESASARVSAAEALCADLGRRISMVEQQAERLSSPYIIAEDNSNKQLKPLLFCNVPQNDHTNNISILSEREHIHSNSSRTIASSFAYTTARPENLNGSVMSPLQSSQRSPRSRLRLRANKDKIIAQARARENILYGKSWGKPLETSRAEIESPSQADSSTEDDEEVEEEEEQHELTKLSQEEHDINVKDEDNAYEKTKVFPTQAILSQSMMVNDERNLSQRSSSRKQSPIHSRIAIPLLPQMSVESPEIYKDVNNNEIKLETEKSSITNSSSQNHGLPIISSKLSSAAVIASPSETAFEAQLTKSKAIVQTPQVTEINVSSHFKDANVQTEETLKDKHISRDKDETTESTTAIALELHAEMSEATALEMALLREKLRETKKTLLLLQQEVANLPSRGVSPLSGDDEDEFKIESTSPTNKVETHPHIINASKLSSSRSSAQTAASALLRCAELEGKLNAAKLEGQVKEQRWISSVQAAQLGVVVKAVQDCVFAIAPTSENAPTPLPLPLRRVHHEHPQGPKRVGIETGPISRSNVAFRQAYWPNERSLFQRPCWSKNDMSTQNSRPSTHSSLYNYNREVNESAERNMKDVINKLRNTLATCEAVVNTNNVAGSFYTT